MGSPSSRRPTGKYSVRLAPRASEQLAVLGDEGRAIFTSHLLPLARRLGRSPGRPGSVTRELESAGLTGIFEVDHEDALITVLYVGRAPAAPEWPQLGPASEGERNGAREEAGDASD